MKLKKFFVLPFIAACLFNANPGFASADIDKPARGSDMDSVQQRYGEPNDRHAPVGDPPITRWVYGQFTVYFEHQYVIHAVTHR